jgi:hypothetical protein
MADLDWLLARLIQGRVEFVVVGGYAAAAHAVSLVTQDIDICCPFTTGNLLRLQEAIADLHPVHRLTPQRIPLHLTRENCADLKNLYLGTDLGPLDCLGEILGLGDYEAIKSHTIELEFPAGRCRFLDLDALIRAKEAMNRPRDQETVLQLRAVKQQRGKRKRD